MDMAMYMTLHKIKLKSNSVLFTDAISLNKTKVSIKWPNNLIALSEAYLEPKRASMMELFCEST